MLPRAFNAAITHITVRVFTSVFRSAETALVTVLVEIRDPDVALLAELVPRFEG